MLARQDSRFVSKPSDAAPVAGRLRSWRAGPSSEVLLLTCFCLALVTNTAYGQNAQLKIKKDVGIDQKLNHKIPLELTFRDSTGQKVQLGNYFGKKPVVLMLVYYRCPMLCNLELKGLVKSLKALEFDVGKQFSVLTVSFNPREGPQLAAEKKATCLEQYGRAGADRGWHFLTGDKDAIRRLTKAVGFRYKPIPEKKQYAHAAGLMMLTPSGKLSRYFYGVEHAPRDLRLGLVEASAETIGSPTDQVLLLCYQYDPATGRYGLAIMNALRVAGVLTVLGLGLGIVLMLRREGRSAAAAPFDQANSRNTHSGPDH